MTVQLSIVHKLCGLGWEDGDTWRVSITSVIEPFEIECRVGLLFFCWENGFWPESTVNKLENMKGVFSVEYKLLT